MPCWNIRTSTVEIGAKTSTPIMADAMRSLGYEIHEEIKNGFTFSGLNSIGTFQQGRFQVQGADLDINQVKDAYLKTGVKAIAKKKGWTMTKVKAKTNRYMLTK